MSYPTSRYPQVPLPVPCPPPSSPDFPYPGLRRTGSRQQSRGRGLQATATFPAGSAIAVFPHPLLCLPDGDHVRTTCDWCLKPGTSSSSSSSSPTAPPHAPQTKLSLCTRCRYASYCSKKCQASAWRATHKLECPALCRIKDSLFGSTRGEKATDPREEKWFVPTPVRAAMQLLLRLGRNDQAVRDAVGGGLPFINSSNSGAGEGAALEGNVQGFRDYGDGTVWKDLGAQARAALSFAGLEVGADDNRAEVAAEGVRRMLCMVQTNAFDRRDEDVGAAGVFLDVDLAMANHSCVPNAHVVFVGRSAVLRAEREIREGEEVEISYIDNTLSKEERQKALELYHFRCQCRRCRDDLDVYQVCQSSPTIPLNILSLQPDLALYSDPPINRAALQKSPLPLAKNTDKHPLWEKCKPLLEAKTYAIEPLPSVLHDLVVRHETAADQNLAHALALSCLLATKCHPFAHVPPFKPWRVKGLMMTAQLLSQTAPLSAAGELGQTCSDRELVARLGRMDQVTVCEAVLRLVVHYGPLGHSDDWEVARGARELLEDIGQLRGRERESMAVRVWASTPERPDARAFFEEVVLGPIDELAEFAIGILEKELRGDDGLALRAPPASLRRLVYSP
ncbi:SET domain-containing protein [Coniochaeta sp. PMI_546]|nr:SET domain-containing protein [Coniochaeta sp. PMI_546]